MIISVSQKRSKGLGIRGKFIPQALIGMFIGGLGHLDLGNLGGRLEKIF